MERKSSRTGSCTGGLSEKFLLADAQGADSPYVTLYNVTSLPSMFIIKDGELVDGRPVDEKSLRRLLDKLLR